MSCRVRKRCLETSITDCCAESQAQGLSIKDPARRAEIHAIVERFLDHGIIILGHELAAFEEDLARFCVCRRAAGVASAPSGLYIALRALDIGVGDKAITTPMTWLVTPNADRLTGATPDFVDVDRHFNMDPSRIEKAVTPRPPAILPMHFYGRVCDMHEIMTVAKCVPDISKARHLLGFEPKVELDDGLAQMIEWYRNLAP